MAVDGELHRDEAARVDETQAVRLVRLKGDVEERRVGGAVLPDAVDRPAVGDGLVPRGALEAPRGEVQVEQGRGEAVVEVGELEDEVAVVCWYRLVLGVDDHCMDQRW